ncbi:Vacuolar membrane protease, partial [Choanephora cucurbitarum]
GGLIGADAFALHPWFSTIKLFVNLEGTGAGGRALLFRSNIMSAVESLASNAYYLHGSMLGNSLLQSRLLRSDTDYTTFSKHGVPGLDISFYYPRSHYHTQRDDLAHTTPESLQHMGQMALGAVLGIDETNAIVEQAGKPEPFIYYDILGRFMLVYSFSTCQLLNLLALVVIPLGFLGLFWTSRSQEEDRKAILKQNVVLIGQSLIATLVAVVLMVVFITLSCLLLLWINPSVTYGSTYFVAVYLFAASFLSLVLSQWILLTYSKTMAHQLTTAQTGLYGLTSFWWLLLLVATILTSQGYAASYFAIYFFVSSALATGLLANTVDSEEEGSRYWSVAFLVQVVLPVTLMTEFLLLVVDSLRHTTADGTPEWAIYGLLATPIVIVVLHLLPWVYAAGDLRRTTFFASLVFVVIMVLCLLISPFDGQISPNRIVFRQEHDVVSNISTVTLVTGTSFGLADKAKEMLSSSEYDSMVCEPYLTYQTRCTYQTDLIPLYARDPQKEIHVAYDSVDCNKKVCRLKIKTQVQHSLLCQLEFTQTDIQGLEAKLNGHWVKQIGNQSIHALTVYSKEQASQVAWDLVYDVDQDHVGEAIFSCIYDDWTEGELPAFTTLKNNLPHYALLTMTGGVGLAKVHYTPISLQ